jgi:hypothetical protein
VLFKTLLLLGCTHSDFCKKHISEQECLGNFYASDGIHLGCANLGAGVVTFTNVYDYYFCFVVAND